MSIMPQHSHVNIKEQEPPLDTYENIFAFRSNHGWSNYYQDNDVSLLTILKDHMLFLVFRISLSSFSFIVNSLAIA